MYTISISQEIKEACPVFAGAAVYAKVRNTTYSEGLWREINAFTEQLTSTTQMEDIKRQPVIAATREAYKRCGKEDRKSTRLNSSHMPKSRMPSSA